jgi:hypothetical protein
MKTKALLFIIPVAIGIAFAGCSNSEQVQKMTDLANKDSLLLVQANQKDSNISAYMSEMREIQENLDQIKSREKIITVNSSENKQTTVAEIKELDAWIVANDKKMNILQGKLKKMTNKNADLQYLVTNLSQQIAFKDTEIAMLQTNLSKANIDLQTVNESFNDSIVVINAERAQVTEMTAEMNTVYYVCGTVKELKDNGVVNKQGGFIGIGRTAKVNQDIDNSKYTCADLTTLKGISLKGKFKKFITTHPDNSYTITSTTDDKADYVSITNPSAFWGESKYMVVALK